MANVTAAELLCLAPQPLLRLFEGLSIPTPALGSPGRWCKVNRASCPPWVPA